MTTTAMETMPPHAHAAATPIGRWYGSADAPATLVVYATYECLHCRRAWPALRALADEGRARIEWRHFAPPGAFPNAPAAASAA
ncbi:MAG: DsbA family protein, partial [Gemmatirosa sp.]